MLALLILLPRSDSPVEIFWFEHKYNVCSSTNIWTAVRHTTAVVVVVVVVVVW